MEDAAWEEAAGGEGCGGLCARVAALFAAPPAPGAADGADGAAPRAARKARAARRAAGGAAEAESERGAAVSSAFRFRGVPKLGPALVAALSALGKRPRNHAPEALRPKPCARTSTPPSLSVRYA